MNIEQIEKRNKAIMENAILWAKGEECDPLYQLDVSVIGGYLNMNLNKCFHNFDYSENVNHVKAYSSHKTIFKQLERIQKKLLEYSLQEVV